MEKIDINIIKYLTKNASPEEQASLLAWLEESEENRTYFRSLKDAYDLGHLESYMKDSQMKLEWNKLTEKIREVKSIRTISRFRSISYTFLRYAAVFLLGALCIQVFHNLNNRIEEELLVNTLVETGVGERSKITLPDGSVVWVNACSSVTYDNAFGQNDRVVTLQGEAYFEVAKDTLKPFMVQADRFTYRVTGTSFNVYAFDEDEEVSIALLEGGVTIEYDGTTHVLYPEQMFTYNKTSKEVTLSKTNVNLLSSWRRGEFVFDNMTFDELVRRLERSYNVKFVFENQKIRKETFGGTLRNYDSLEMIMKVIQTGIPVQYRIEENVVYIK